MAGEANQAGGALKAETAEGLRRYDVNQDGKLSGEELRAAAAKLKERLLALLVRPTPDREAAVAKIEAEFDRVRQALALLEVLKRDQARIDLADLEASGGALDAAELTRLRRFDRDGDGTLTRDELNQAVDETLERYATIGEAMLGEGGPVYESLAATQQTLSEDAKLLLKADGVIEARLDDEVAVELPKA